jgi:hypothetical protein
MKAQRYCKHNKIRTPWAEFCYCIECDVWTKEDPIPIPDRTKWQFVWKQHYIFWDWFKVFKHHIRFKNIKFMENSYTAKNIMFILKSGEAIAHWRAITRNSSNSIYLDYSDDLRNYKIKEIYLGML